jgi:hypothetical protein
VKARFSSFLSPFLHETPQEKINRKIIMPCESKLNYNFDNKLNHNASYKFFELSGDSNKSRQLIKLHPTEVVRNSLSTSVFRRERGREDRVRVNSKKRKIT